MKDLVVPKGFVNTQDNILCPICDKKEVYHIAHHKVKSGMTNNFICLNCNSTWGRNV